MFLKHNLMTQKHIVFKSGLFHFLSETASSFILLLPFKCITLCWQYVFHTDSQPALLVLGHWMDRPDFPVYFFQAKDAKLSGIGGKILMCLLCQINSFGGKNGSRKSVTSKSVLQPLPLKKSWRKPFSWNDFSLQGLLFLLFLLWSCLNRVWIERQGKQFPGHLLLLLLLFPSFSFALLAELALLVERR